MGFEVLAPGMQAAEQLVQNIERILRDELNTTEFNAKEQAVLAAVKAVAHAQCQVAAAQKQVSDAETVKAAAEQALAKAMKELWT